jgi:hypothetical protein
VINGRKEVKRMITGLQLRLSYQLLERIFQPNCRIVQELGIVTGSSLQGNGR